MHTHLQARQTLLRGRLPGTPARRRPAAPRPPPSRATRCAAVCSHRQVVQSFWHPRPAPVSARLPAHRRLRPLRAHATAYWLQPAPPQRQAPGQGTASRAGRSPRLQPAHRAPAARARASARAAAAAARRAAAQSRAAQRPQQARPCTSPTAHFSNRILVQPPYERRRGPGCTPPVLAGLQCRVIMVSEAGYAHL